MARLRLRTLVACDDTLVTCDEAIVSTWDDIELFTAPLLRDHLSALAAPGCRRLVLNLSRTSYMGSAGPTVPAHVHKALRVTGGELALARCGPTVAHILHLSGFHTLFAIEECPARVRQKATA